MGNILTRIHVRILKNSTNDGWSLSIDSVDPQHACMIQARLVCEKTHKIQPHAEFCIDSNILNNCLKNIPSHYSVDLKKMTHDERIHSSHGYETLSNSHTLEYQIPTLVDDSETMQLSDMAYKYIIEIDLSTLRNIVKMSQTLRAQQIEFQVSESAVVAQLSQHRRKGRRRAQAQILLVDGARIDRGHPRAPRRDRFDEPHRQRGRRCTDRLLRAFSAQYLSLFLKSMERSIITMKLSKDKPLIIHYPLGAEASHICFVLAPKTPDDE